MAPVEPRGPRALVLVACVLAPLTSAAQVPPGRTPFDSKQDVDAATSPTTPTIAVHAPGETEVTQADRGVINRETSLAIPLEEPLDPDKYICGRGDVFELNFWGQQNFRLRIVVDVEGRTFISKVGYVRIVGKTLTQARDIIKQAVHRYYPGLNFDMSLAMPRTFLLHLIGYVKHPGIYEATPIERLTTVLKRAGDVVGSNRLIDIKRRDGTHITADLLMYQITGDTKYNPFVMDGDVITVPYPDLVVGISGAVRRPGRYELIATKDLAELLELAGGLTTSATHRLPIRVVHLNDKQQSVTSEVPFPEGGPQPNPRLHAQDNVYIPSTTELQRSVLVIGAVAGASAADEATATRRVLFSEGMTVSQLISDAGGVGASANLRGSFIRRKDAVIHIDLDKLLVQRDMSADVKLQMDDTLVIPPKRFGVMVEGAVMHPAVYPFNPDLNGSQYVAIAGGPKTNARGSGAFKLISPHGVESALTSKSILAPGDTILVPERAFTRGEVAQIVVASVGIAVSCFTLVYLVTR